MSDVAISVENISKCYRIGTQGGPPYHRLSEMITGIPRALWNAGKSVVRQRSPAASPKTNVQNSGEFWALEDVSFEVKQGEVVGIIGHNGAGKSTLLKILSRITEPTSGRFGVRGRVASLLEVGTGFHPELTGRENIYVSGITLGMTRAEIRKRFDEIVEFSGVEKFLDTPVKHYSSGMQVRLGFAVAAHLDSEILIVDEVLAVGDAEFQKRCLGTMGTAVRGGRTILMVSHQLVAIKGLCTSVLWLKNGTVISSGSADRVIRDYAETSSTQENHVWETPDDAPGNENVRIRSLSVTASPYSKSSGLTVSDDLQVTIEFWIMSQGVMLTPSLVLKSSDGTVVLNSFPEREYLERCTSGLPALSRWVCEIPSQLLNDDRYVVDVYIIRNRSTCEWCHADALAFDLLDQESRQDWYGKWPGVVRPRLRWSLTQLSNDLAIP